MTLFCSVCNSMMRDDTCVNKDCLSKGGQEKFTGVSQEDFMDLQQQVKDIAHALNRLSDVTHKLASATELISTVQKTCADRIVALERKD